MTYETKTRLYIGLEVKRNEIKSLKKHRIFSLCDTMSNSEVTPCYVIRALQKPSTAKSVSGGMGEEITNTDLTIDMMDALF